MEDIFESSLSSLFSQPVIAHSLAPSETHFLYPHASLPTPFKLLIPQSPPKLNFLQTSYLWPSSLYLAHLLLSETIPLRKDGSERIAELGAGSGLAGVAAGWMMRGGGGELVDTDFGDEGILNALRENLEINLGPSKEKGGLRWEVLPHEWGTSPTPLLLSPPSTSPSPRRFTTLLLADLLYYTAGHSALLASIFALLAPSEEGGVAHFTAGLHGGRGAVERFGELARAAGCVVEEKEVVVWDSALEKWVKVGREEEDGEGRVWRGVLKVGKRELELFGADL